MRHSNDVMQLTSGRYDLLKARDGSALFILGNEATLADLKARGFDAFVHSNRTGDTSSSRAEARPISSARA
jgi:hypothetical protein